MYEVIDEDGFVRGLANDLTMALEMAKVIDEFVTITNGTIEIVGKFGAKGAGSEYVPQLLQD